MTRGFAIVGTGVAAAIHADAIAMLPGARLVAVTDAAFSAASSFAAARGCHAEPDLDALLARGDVEVVCMCTPSGLHAQLGIQVVRASKHLVVEKPIDVTLDAADRLIDAAHAAGVALTVISQHRFDPGLLELRRLLDDGSLGRPILGEASTKWYRSPAYYNSAGWRGTHAMDGGSLMNQGIHYVDLLRWCMGPPAEVTAVCSTLAHRIPAEDTSLAIVRFVSGAVGTILSSTASFPGFPQRLEITGTEGTVTVEDGRIARRMLVTDSGAKTSAASQQASRSVLAAPAALGVASHSAQLADLLDAVDNDREPAINGESARAALEIVLAVYKSSRTGRPVTMKA